MSGGVFKGVYLCLLPGTGESVSESVGLCLSPGHRVAVSKGVGFLTWGRGGNLQQSDAVIKSHGLDVEGAENGFFVHQVWVVQVLVLRRHDHAHVTQVDVHCSQVGSIQW